MNVHSPLEAPCVPRLDEPGQGELGEFTCTAALVPSPSPCIPQRLGQREASLSEQRGIDLGFNGSNPIPNVYAGELDIDIQAWTRDEVVRLVLGHVLDARVEA